MLEKVKHDIIAFWLTHCFLRRIGKRYPYDFEKMIDDITDNLNCRRVMKLRYTGKTQLKFEAIAYEMNADIRNVFMYHRRVIDKIISDS